MKVIEMPTIPDSISTHPKIMIIIVILITGSLGGVYLTMGGEMEATEETFMPSNEVVDASNKIGSLFTTSEFVQVLARGKNGNVLTPESLIEILKVEEAMLENENISYLLLDETNPMRVSSVSENIIQAKGLLDTIEGMVGGIGPQFDQMGQVFGQISNAIRLSREGIQNSLGTPYLGQAIMGANSTIMALVGQLAQMGGMGPPAPGSGSGMPSGPQQTVQGFDEKIGFYQNMTKEDIEGLIEAILSYDESYTDGMVTAVIGAIENGEQVVSEVEQLNQTLLIASQDPSIAQDPQAQTALATVGFTVPLIKSGVATAYQQAVDMDIEVLAKQLDSGIIGLGRGIRLTLTTDFAPENGAYQAEATLIMVGFNASLARGEGDATGFGPPGAVAQENASRMLIAQESMVSVIDEQDLSSTSMIVIGMDITSREILEATQDSFQILLPAAFLLVIIVLGLVYRNVLDMVASLLALGFAIVWTYGIGTLAGFVFNPMTLAVPVVIAGLGIDYGIHLTLRYKEERANGETPRESARTSISWVGSALLIATITTLAAFAANLTSEMAALRDFGILLGVGIASAFVIMVTFVPSIRQILDNRSSKTPREDAAKKGRSPSVSNTLGAGALAAEHHPRIIILATLIITALALSGAMQLETRFELIDFLPDNLDYAREIKFVFEGFNASTGFAQASILIQGDLTNPAVLEAIDTVTLNMVDDELVAMKSTPVGDRPDVDSILSLIRDVATDESLTNPLDLYNAEFEDLYKSTLEDGDEVPDREIEALLAWLYDNKATGGTTRSLLHRNSDGIFDYTVIRVGVTSDEIDDAYQLQDELTVDVTPLNGLTGSGELEQATVTGSSIMIKQIIDSLQDSLTTSFIFTLIVSFGILTIVFFITERSVVLGAITMIPVLLSSAWILGSMYVLEIPYTVMTVMVTSLTVGLGVTYGIHLTHRFVEEMREHGNVDEGCMETVIHTGSALFGAAATTIAGFGLLVFSLLPPIQEFGAIVALTIAYSFLTTVFILPTFLVMWAKRTMKT
jgi:hydrophobe/amphiphile efflux-3 (HAE3) family protein